MSVRFDRSEENELSYTLNRKTTQERVAFGDVTELNAAAFVDANWQLSPKLRLQGALRYDRFRFQYLDLLQTRYQPESTTSGIFAPKLSLFYQLADNWQLFARAARGFHSNDTRLILEQEVESSLPGGNSFDAGAPFSFG